MGIVQSHNELTFFTQHFLIQGAGQDENLLAFPIAPLQYTEQQRCSPAALMMLTRCRSPSIKTLREPRHLASMAEGEVNTRECQGAPGEGEKIPSGKG